MENNIIEVDCKNFIDSNYFGLIENGKQGQYSSCSCAYVERVFCNSGECEIKESKVKKEERN